MSEYFPDELFDEHETESNSLEIASGLHRYRQGMSLAQAEHTGSADRFLSRPEEQECAVTIEAARRARDGIAELRERDSKRADLEQARFQKLLDAGKQAENRLVESNLRYAAYCARMSMNITSGEQSGAQFKGRPGGFADMRKLASRHAVLEDRIQVANLGLIKAAQAFHPKLMENGEPVSFISFAKYNIYKALQQYAMPEETPGWFVNANQIHILSDARRNLSTVEPEELERLAQMEQGRYTTPIEDLLVSRHEVEEELEAPKLADVVADTNESASVEAIVLENKLHEALSRALDTLSEREEGIIRLRFGLDGDPQTLDEIAKVYGVSRDRIRQIESKALGKLRHPSRADLFRDYLDKVSDPEGTFSFVVPYIAKGTTNIKLERGMARARDPEDIILSDSSKKESWQAYPGEAWDMDSEENATPTHEKVAEQFELILKNASPYAFQHSFGENMKTPYPVSLVKTINEQLGVNLKSGHIEDFWNEHIGKYVDTLRSNLGDDFSLDRVSTFFSHLLTERMRDDDRVMLTIPSELDGKLNGFGTGLGAGELVLHGNMGDFVGYQMQGLAHIIVTGSVGDFAGVEASGFSSLEIMENTGSFLGGQASEAANIHVHGSTTDYCGEGIRSADVVIEIDDNAGECVGDNALDGMIVIQGNAAGSSIRPDFKGTIIGDFADGTVNKVKDGPRPMQKIGTLAIGFPNGERAAQHISASLSRSTDAIARDIKLAAEAVSPDTLAAMDKKDTSIDPDTPKMLTFEQACNWFGVTQQYLQTQLDVIGHPKGANLTAADITAVVKYSPDLYVETIPTDRFVTVESAKDMLGIRETAEQFRITLQQNGASLYRFRDVDGKVKYCIPRNVIQSPKS